jgi:hypothetical protein
MSNHQTATAFPVCLALLGATLLAIGAIGAENRRLLAQCEPIYGIAQCELKILGR